MSNIEKLSVIAGKNLNQTQWQYIKKNMMINNQKQIDDIRFIQKKKLIDSQFNKTLSDISNPSHRVYTRSSLLAKINLFYKASFYESSVLIPSISNSTQAYFLHLLKLHPLDVYSIPIYYRGKNYIIYYIKTFKNISQSVHYPKNKILKICFYNDKIIDIEEL